MTLVLIGGGEEVAGGWSDALFEAIASGHTVAVLGTSESSEPGWYRDYLLSLGALDAEELVIATRAEAEAADLSRFDAFFLRGGDQWDYVREWDDTPVEDAILAASVVGGTSAGAMVLGGLDYTAEDGGIDPEDVLAGYGGTLATGFLDDLYPGVIVDTHFTQRGRIGRLLPWTACEGAQGLGIDDMTGVVMGPGWMRVYGTGTVTIVSEAYGECTAGEPPRVWDSTVSVVNPYDSAEPMGGLSEPHDAPWAGADVHVEAGTEGTWTLLHPREDDLYCGTLEITPGTGQFAGIATSDAWNADTVESRVGGTIYALPTLSLPVGILMPAGTAVDVLPEGGFAATGDAAAIVLLAEGGYTADAVGWQDEACEGPRMARALTDLRVAVVPPGWTGFPGEGPLPPADDDTGEPVADTGDPAANADDGGGEPCGCHGGSAALLVPIALLGRRRRRVW